MKGILLMVLALAAGWGRAGGMGRAGPSITLLPAKVAFTGAEATQQLLVMQVKEGEFVGEASQPRFSSSRPDIARVSARGLVEARSNGEAVITARTGDGRQATMSVTVRGSGTPRGWSFRNDVLPVLSKAGCNSGACHGARAGKGGFRLSLRGYDPISDYAVITRQARGRRVELADPARSLVLVKPTTAVRHKGGRRLEPGSRDYRILAQWIAQGAPAPSATDARLERLEVLPARTLLKPGDSQHLVVRAFYTSGREVDVTRWAKYSSTDETVASVDAKSGEIRVVGYGEGAVTVWFSSRIVIARVTSPYPNRLPEALFTQAPQANLIDRLVLAQLRRLNLPPSPRVRDPGFIRRAFLDAIGRLPTPREVRDFIKDRRSDKRDRLIARLLARPEFVDYWTYRWSDIFLISSRLLRPDALKAYYGWLRGQVTRDTPWDQLVRQVVTAKGDSLDNGASNFFAVHQDPESMAENVSQAFLSLSIGCAKCHNHPLEKWTNDQYYSFANLFSRVRAKGWGGDPGSGDGRRTLYVAPRGDLIQPRTGKAQPPAPLDGPPIPVAAEADRRVLLADWLTSPDNPYFTRAIANRVWAAFMGVGLVEPVDDLRVSNPPSNAALLNALATFLVERHYDLKALMRLIMGSETYQRSSDPLPGNQRDERYFSRYYPRRLMAEVLEDAISDVTRVPSKFSEIALRDGSRRKVAFYAEGTRALQLDDSAVASYFLKTFGRNERAITCECERSNQPSMVQVLHLSNGATLNGKLREKSGRVSRLLDQGLTDDALIDHAYLLCLSRFPARSERKEFQRIFQETLPDEKRAAIEDLFWALMTSREFLFQH